jgi:hypothetical protein
MVATTSIWSACSDRITRTGIWSRGTGSPEICRLTRSASRSACRARACCAWVSAAACTSGNAMTPATTTTIAATAASSIAGAQLERAAATGRGRQAGWAAPG